MIKNFAGKVLNKNKIYEKMINGNTLVQNYKNQTNPTKLKSYSPENKKLWKINSWIK